MFDSELAAVADKAARKSRQITAMAAPAERSCGALASASTPSIAGANAHIVASCAPGDNGAGRQGLVDRRERGGGFDPERARRLGRSNCQQRRLRSGSTAPIDRMSRLIP
jgi:hypothetical protein